MSTEKLHFEIGLSGTYWDKKPQYSILVDSQVQRTGTVTELEFIEFDLDLDETEHLLEIRLENKEDKDTVQLEDLVTIEKDMLLNIETLSIDNIDVTNLKWSKSRYVLDKPAEVEGKMITEYERCCNLGHNGSWKFAFTSPFYIWLLENL